MSNKHINYRPLKNPERIGFKEEKTIKQLSEGPSENFKKKEEKFMDLLERQSKEKEKQISREKTTKDYGIDR